MNSFKMTHITQTSLISHFNASLGYTQWKPVDSDYDYAQEIARSGYGDMLHDVDRNQKFHLAIQKAIAYRRQIYPHRPVHVLDIGTGTGLLAMMAARAGADTVTACEAFPPVANCARTVLMDNGLSDKVHLINKRSTDMIIGSDMENRANLLVAELLDTELIGEAALSTYKHAAENLLDEEPTLVPYAADLYVQVVESPFLWSHHKLTAFLNSDQLSLGVFTPAFRQHVMTDCAGAPSVFDIQCSELALVTDRTARLGDRQIRCLLDKPLLVKRFNFAPPVTQINLQESILLTHTEDGNRLVACCTGTAHAFIVWWRLKMEPTNTVPDISTAPSWSGDPEYSWRDHWMQAVYFPRRELTLQCDEPLSIRFTHDSLSLWFDLVHDDPMLISNHIERPVCDCGMHYSWSRNRIAQLNSSAYANMTERIIQQLHSILIDDSSTSAVDLIVVSDCTVLSLLVANLLEHAKSPRRFRVCHVETSPYSRRFLRSIFEKSTDLTRVNIVSFESVDQLIGFYKHLDTCLPGSIFVVAEPYTASGLLPWSSLLFHYARARIIEEFPTTNVILICPTRLRIYGVLADFVNLWKVRAPVDAVCETVNVKAFDRLIQRAISQVDALVEPQPLWEYPARARSHPVLLFDMDFTDLQSFPSISVSDGVFTLTTPNFNGIVFWAEWLTQPDGSDGCGNREVWSSPAGPSSTVVPDQLIQWDASGPAQGVLLAPWRKVDMDVNVSQPLRISIFTEFERNTGEISFRVKGI